MLKLIFKNLIAYRRRYLWIMIELCLAVFISWEMIDNIVISTYVESLPVGYDMDRLATFLFHERPAEAMGQGYEERDINAKMDDVKHILDIIRSDPRVEAATIAHANFRHEGSGSITNTITDKRRTDEDGDYVYIPNVQIYFWRGTDFFKTYGFKDASGFDLKEFDEPKMSKSQYIVSKSIAEGLFPDENAVGRSVYEFSDGYDPDEDRGVIAAVVNESSYRSIYDRFPAIFRPKNDKDVEREGGVDILSGVIRLKEGVNVNSFVTDYSPKINEELRFGEIYCSDLESYTDLSDSVARDHNNSMFMMRSIALFFFVNVLLCMVGTFYLQTRKRKEEVGIMRSFGATRGFILREMLAEGVVMVTLACIVGCSVYYLLIQDSGLVTNDFMGNSERTVRFVREMIPRWFDSFGLHFAVVTGVVYLTLLTAVLAGIFFPALKISRINPIDALRDE